MSNSSTVNLLIDMAQKKRDAAAVKLANAQAQCQEAEKKERLLKQYRADYQVRQRGTQSTDAIVLSNFHAFLEKLETAVTHQHYALLSARRNALQARQDWERAVQHFKSIEVLQRRRAAAVQVSATRVMQKHHDELAVRMAAYPLTMAG